MSMTVQLIFRKPQKSAKVNVSVDPVQRPKIYGSSLIVRQKLYKKVQASRAG